MEVLDVYNDEGKPINKTVTRPCRDEDFELGEHFAVSIIFIENNNGEFLVQKTPKGDYSSTGGHILSGETPMNAVIRETKEEIGLDISKEKIEELGFRTFDLPLRFLFYLKKDVDINKVKVDNEEAVSVEWMSKDSINSLIENGNFKRGHALLFRELLKYKTGEESLNDIFTKYKEYDVKYPNDSINYFELYIEKYKILVSLNSICILKKKMFCKKKLWVMINEIKDIESTNILCERLNRIIKKYERKCWYGKKANQDSKKGKKHYCIIKK